MEMFGREPNPEDIPIDIEDLSYESQLAFEIYSYFPESWEGMSGSYLGKNWSGINDIFNIYEFSNQQKKILLSLLKTIDQTVAEDIAQKMKRTKSKN